LFADARRLGRNTIRVYVDEDENRESFLVHKDLIVSRSKFFAKALNGPWREAEDKVVNLPEDDAETFALYLSLLYFGAMFIPGPEAKAQGTEDPRAKSRRVAEQEYISLSKLYVLCDKVQDITGVRIVTDAFVKATQKKRADGRCHFPGEDPINITYDNTPDGCPLRSLLVDLYVFHAEAKWLGDCGDDLPKDFLFDIAMGMVTSRAEPRNKDKVAKSSNYYPKADTRS
jgi:hypothetical protein